MKLSDIYKTMNCICGKALANGEKFHLGCPLRLDICKNCNKSYNEHHYRDEDMECIVSDEGTGDVYEPIELTMWAADLHEFGPGKVHIVNIDNDQKTFCGRWLRAVPGKFVDDKVATCVQCRNCIVAREERNKRQKQWQIDSLQRQQEQDQVWERRRQEYRAYLQTPAWMNRRNAVMQRANGRCESCGIATATEVHHKTYEHIFNEPLFDLVAICRSCHEKITLIDRERKFR